MFTYAPKQQPDAFIRQKTGELLKVLGKHYVVYYKVLAEITNSPKAALMLGHAMFMTRIVMEKQFNRKGSHEGWFYKTTDEWYLITGLTVREIESARKILTSMGILHERRQGMPAKLWYRVDLDKLAFYLCDFTNREYRTWDWQDRVLKAILGKPILFYVPFAWLTNSATAGLYMSSLIGILLKSARDNTLQPKGWFNTAIKTSLADLAIGRHALENAREKLISKEIIAEKRENKAMASMLSQINLAELPHKIALEVNEINSKSKYDIHVCRNPSDKSSRKRRTRVHENVKQEFAETQNKSSPNSETSSAENGTLSYIKKNTAYQQQHNNINSSVIDMTMQSAQILEVEVTQLIFPNSLIPEERLEVKKLIQKHEYQNCRHQLVLDEWTGRLATGGITRNPIGYLRCLLDKEQAGTLTIEIGFKVKQKRDERKAMLENRPQTIETPKPTSEGVQKGLSMLSNWKKQKQSKVVESDGGSIS